MADNIYNRIHRTLTWKRIITFNVLLFLATVVPLSVRLAQEDTENRSGAAGELAVPSVTPLPAYPSNPPRLERVTEFFGKKGDTIVLLGSNFGAYKWGSKLFVGNVEATDENVVRWSDSVIEVQIPEGARTGKVWVVVNGQESAWEGSLLLYDLARSAQIGIRAESLTQAVVWIGNGAGVTRGMIEFAHVSEPLTVTIENGQITRQSQGVDSLGKKTTVEFALNTPLSAGTTNVLRVSYPGIGTLEVLRTELYDEQERLLPVYADPFNVKIN